MASSLYTIGLSGVRASNALITTTGQNTANVNTPGYTRQTTSLATLQNGGVYIQNTERVMDEFVNQQVRSDTATYNYYKSYNDLAKVSDGIFGDQSASLNTYMNDVFDAMQSVNNDPTNLATREIAHANFNNLVNQYNALAGFVADQNELANNQLQDAASDLNQYLSLIADLNDKILVQETVGTTKANELRDQQEELAKSVAEFLDVKVSYDENQLMTLQLASGQPLVLKGNANELKLTPNDLDPNKFDMTLDFGKYEVGVDDSTIGGKIGGILGFRDGMLTQMDRMLGQQAIVLADAFNNQNKLGLDASGNYGANLFSLAAISVTQSSSNSSLNHDVSIRPESGKSDEITTNTYTLTMTSATAFEVREYDLNGKATGNAVSVDTATATPSSAGYFSVAGFGIEVQLTADAPTSFAPGDLYQFSPTKQAAEGLKYVAASGEALALNSPITVSRNSNNLSNAEISISSVTNLDPATSGFSTSAGLDSTAPHNIYFTDATTFQVRDSANNVLATVTPVTDYSNLLAQAGLSPGYDVSLSSAPKPEDQFDIAFNQSGRADNYNGLKLAALQNQNLVSGSQNFTDAYTSLVTQVGSFTRASEVNMDANEVMLQQSVARRDEISAVSLDEEAVNLIRFQQSYSASAQVITAARDTFQTLLSAVR